MKFFNKRRLKWMFSASGLAVLGLIGLGLFLGSRGFQEYARSYAERQISQRTGGRATLQRLRWNLWTRHVILEDLTLRGKEADSAPALAHIASIDIGFAVRSVVQHRIDLTSLLVTRPEFHITVDERGNTNFPTPPPQNSNGTDFHTSIDSFKIVRGSGTLNEKRVDLDFALNNVESDLHYANATQILSAHLAYEGALVRTAASDSIPYGLSMDFDFTRGTMLAKTMDIRSAASTIRLQGRIDNVLNAAIHGRLEYNGEVEVPFLNHFFADKRFSGKSSVAGQLDFANGSFSTAGRISALSLMFENWTAQDLRGDYTYRYPDRELTLTGMSTRAVGGSATGTVRIHDLPGNSRIQLDLNYFNVDAAALARVYPWDQAYRIYSRVRGDLHGWFEGAFERYAISGTAGLQAYTPPLGYGIVALPVDGSAGFDATPDAVQVRTADLRFFSTAVQADGVIREQDSNLNVHLNSSDLANAYFLYAAANGSGTFAGTLKGPIRRPLLDGSFTLDNHRHGAWTVEHAAGNATLDTAAETAQLRDVVVTQGLSRVALNGNTTLDGANIDMRIQSDRIRAEDVKAFLKRDFAGTFSGSMRVTSLMPLRFEGDGRGADVVFEGQTVQSIQGHIRYDEPAISVQNIDATDAGTKVTGDLAYNPTSEAVAFSLLLSSLDLQRLQPFGLPEGLTGFVETAQLRGSGTRLQPGVEGQAVIRDVAVHGETFSRVSLAARSTGSRLNVTANTMRDIDLTAQIDTSTKDYPFTAHAAFRAFPVRQLADFGLDNITVSGQADLAGSLADTTTLRGTGRIDSTQVLVQQRSLQLTKPFSFSFNPERLTVTGASFGGDGTELGIAGTVGLTEAAELNLDVQGQMDLALLSAANPAWVTTGAVRVDGRVGGTARNPDLRGLAHLNDAAVSRRGVFTSLIGLNGDIFFNGNRINLNNIQGQMGGGTVNLQGTALLEDSQLNAMNVRITTNGVRIRYPEGLRTVVDGTLVLRGSSTTPLLDGSLQIRSLSYQSEFEKFLALFQEGALKSEDSEFGRLRLSVRVEGNRDIHIQNELADVDARVSLSIGGTVADPSLTGHIEASGGTITFQGSRYEITRGNIDFVDPLRINPVIDLQAEADLRDYRVILTVSGRSDRLHMDLRSEGLSQLEVVSLIAGGKTSQELADRGTTGVTNEQLFQGGAASILADLLVSRVGVGRVGLLDLGRVRLDPSLGSTSSTSARITVPVQVTKDLTITYSRDVSSDRQEIVQIEYFVSKNISLLATRDETGALGLDVRLRKRY